MVRFGPTGGQQGSDSCLDPHASVARSGVASYNVTPNKAGLYFNKLQCFCFEEQKLQAREDAALQRPNPPPSPLRPFSHTNPPTPRAQAKETVEMPVFFFVDPEFAKDPNMEDVQRITLSYAFFNTSGMTSEQIAAITEKNRSGHGDESLMSKAIAS